jgi:hypothetical protein
MVTGMIFSPTTSPTAVVLNSKLYVFWAGAANDGIWYTTYDGGSQWIPQQGIIHKQASMAFAQGTSPSATYFGGQIWLFYTDKVTTSPYYTTYSPSSDSWSVPIQLPITGIKSRAGTSPCVISDDSNLIVSWINISSETSYAKYVSENWTQEASHEGQSVLAGTSVGGSMFIGIPHFFFARADQNIYFVEDTTYEMNAQALAFFNGNLLRQGMLKLAIKADDVVSFFWKPRADPLDTQEPPNERQVLTYNGIEPIAEAIRYCSKTLKYSRTSARQITAVLTLIQVAVLGLNLSVTVTRTSNGADPTLILTFSKSAAASQAASTVPATT